MVLDLVKDYLSGLQFVLGYYFKSVPSWNWYFRHYYSPLASDIYAFVKYQNKHCESLNTEFIKGKPFDPFVHLLLCLPSESSSLLPV